jgi:hypothetical protein
MTREELLTTATRIFAACLARTDIEDVQFEAAVAAAVGLIEEVDVQMYKHDIAESRARRAARDS